jgi:hypothetical protein
MIVNTSNDLSKDNVRRLSLEVRSILCAKFNTYPHKVSIGLGLCEWKYSRGGYEA